MSRDESGAKRVASPRARKVRAPAARKVVDTGAAARLGAGRPLPRLLFATSLTRLAANVGAAKAQAAIDVIRTAGQQLLDVQSPADPFAEVSQIARGSAGVVVVGGYDVLPATRLDVLDQQLRSAVGRTDDDDDFIVWSDDRYADLDGDGVAELPISRIPDGNSAALLLAALSANCAQRPQAAGQTLERYGLRNIARPFAETIYRNIAGHPAMLVSKPTTSAAVQTPAIAVQAAYFMLHGDYADTEHFWGEQTNGSALEAFRADKVPSACDPIVLTGCCWGALTVQTRAVDYAVGQPLRQISPARSIALSFLGAGAPAFVGCTGSHYSPTKGAGYFGGPMHKAFWSGVERGLSPAQSLFDAKAAYARGMPHGQGDPVGRAIELKILRQFTCLGLGW